MKGTGRNTLLRPIEKRQSNKLTQYKVKSHLFHFVKATWGFSPRGCQRRITVRRARLCVTSLHTPALWWPQGGWISLAAQPVRVQGVRKQETWKEITQIPAWCSELAAALTVRKLFFYLIILCSLNLAGFPLRTGALTCPFGHSGWKLQTVLLQASLLSQSKASFSLDRVTSWSWTDYKNEQGDKRDAGSRFSRGPFPFFSKSEDD